MNQILSYEIDPQEPSKIHFIAKEALLETTEEFRSADEALRSPLAAKLFGFPWAEAVILQGSEVILQKADWVEWEVLADPLAQLISDHLEAGEPILFNASSFDDEDDESPRQDWQVQAAETPNPATLKFQVNHPIADDMQEFQSGAEASNSPLAEKLFGFPWTESVFIGKDFVSVTKAEWVQWDGLAEPLSKLITEHLESGAPVLLSRTEAEESENDSAQVKTIKKILNEEIRPAVAMDGGDILFQRYEENTVYLYMKGACAGCPSSTMTLKMGIEGRLKEAVPEIREVVAL